MKNVSAGYTVTNFSEVIWSWSLSSCYFSPTSQTLCTNMACIQAIGLIANIHTDFCYADDISHGLGCFGNRGDSLLPVRLKLGTVFSHELLDAILLPGKLTTTKGEGYSWL